MTTKREHGSEKQVVVLQHVGDDDEVMKVGVVVDQDGVVHKIIVSTTTEHYVVRSVRASDASTDEGDGPDETL